MSPRINGFCVRQCFFTRKYRADKITELINIKKMTKQINREKILLWGLVLIYGPVALWGRFYFLNNALLEPHPWRQTQTALTIMQLFHGSGSLWDYRSPLSGMLWNNVYEFPIYQWVVSRIMFLGGGLEVVSRLVTLFCFLLSALFAYLIGLKLWGRKIANWFLILYLINPFGVIFSRVCLIDFFALAFTLGSIYGLIRIRDDAKSKLGWLLFSLGGVIAGLAKINIWFFVTFSALGILVGECWMRRSEKKDWLFKLFGVLALQILVIFAWNYHRLHTLHSPADTPWLIGILKQRFELWRWKKIIWDFGVRSFFFDALVIPWLVGSILLFKQNWKLFAIIYGICLAHTLIFFQVQTYHDYYLIAVMPYLYYLVALGVECLCRSKSIKGRVAFAVMGLLLVYKATKLPVFYSTIVHDYRPELTEVFQLKRHTDPKDIVYWDAKQGRFEIATYSERKVGLSETFKLIGANDEKGGKYSPTVFHFDSQKLPLEVFENYPKVWVDGEKDFILLRTASVGKFAFVPERQLAVLSWVEEKSQISTFKKEVNNCGASSAVLMALPKGVKELKVEGDDFSLSLPGGKLFLNVPSESNWGCKIKIKVVT